MEDKENSADGEVQDQDEDPETDDTDDTDWDVSEPKRLTRDTIAAASNTFMEDIQQMRSTIADDQLSPLEQETLLELVYLRCRTYLAQNNLSIAKFIQTSTLMLETDNQEKSFETSSNDQGESIAGVPSVSDTSGILEDTSGCDDVFEQNSESAITHHEELNSSNYSLPDSQTPRSSSWSAGENLNQGLLESSCDFTTVSEPAAATGDSTVFAHNSNSIEQQMENYENEPELENNLRSLLRRLFF